MAGVSGTIAAKNAFSLCLWAGIAGATFNTSEKKQREEVQKIDDLMARHGILKIDTLTAPWEDDDADNTPNNTQPGQERPVGRKRYIFRADADRMTPKEALEVLESAGCLGG